LKKTRLKVIALDFDGTLVESNNIKDRAFETIFSDWPEHTEIMIKWHLAHDAIERKEKFSYFVKNILELPCQNELIEKLTYRFGQLTKTAIIECPFVEGADEFLQYIRNKISVYLVSATPQMELEDIISERELGQYFKDIYGSPLKKDLTLKNIMLLEAVADNEILFIGDSPEDQESAQHLGIDFIGIQSGRKLVYGDDNIFTDFFEIKRYMKNNYDLQG
jgi:phosphoglycolate phosphatase-like HAD superfamily hydrolase